MLRDCQEFQSMSPRHSTTCPPTLWQCRYSLPGQRAAMQVCGTGLSLPRSLPRSLLQPGNDLQGKEESSPAAPLT